jgi:hypothetical protein
MKGSFSIGSLLMNIAIACYLIATGILGLGDAKLFSRFDPEVRQAVTALFGKGDFTNVIVVIISILAIAAGVFILMRLFDFSFPSIDLILIILAIVWVVFIIMIDIVAPINSKQDFNFVNWLRIFAPHLMVLAGLVSATGKFG